MTSAEIAEKLEAIADDRSLTLSERQYIDLRQAAGKLREMEDDMQRRHKDAVNRYEALAGISIACPYIKPHPQEQAYDFGSQYFNTSDDYARYCVAKNLSDIGDKARAALQKDQTS